MIMTEMVQMMIPRTPHTLNLGLDMHTDDSDVTFNVCLGQGYRNHPITH